MEISDKNVFFKYVWRLNALLIAITFGLVLLGLSFSMFNPFARQTDRNVKNIVNTEGSAKAPKNFSFGFPEPLSGTDIVRIQLLPDRAYAVSGSYSGSGGYKTNYFFMNAATGEGKWLVNDIHQIFTSDVILKDHITRSFTFDAQAANATKSLAIVYTVVEKDTNKDSALTPKDIMAVAVSGIDGSDYRKIIDGIETLYSVSQISDDKMLILYQKDKETISEVYSVSSLKQISRKSIPSIDAK